MATLYRASWLVYLVGWAWIFDAHAASSASRASGDPSPDASELCQAWGPPQDCRIEVRVREFLDGDQAVCEVSIAQDQADVEFWLWQRPHFITWELIGAPEGYRFAADGIALKKPAEGNPDLRDFQRIAQGLTQRYRVRNMNQTPHEYEYAIKVEKIVDRQVVVACELDPFIRNR